MKEWIDANLSLLSSTNPVHVHIDELATLPNSPQEALHLLEETFLHSITILGNRLTEIMPVAMIPLGSTETLICSPPTPGSLDLDLESEPPSVYFLHRDGVKTLRLGELYRIPLRGFEMFRSHPDVFFFYEVFRAEKARAAGWEYTRTILGEHYPAEHRSSWDSTLEWK